MTMAQESQHATDDRSPGSFRGNLASAARFWEPWRLAFNAVLLAVFCGWVAASWPHFRPAMTPLHLAQFAVLGLIANVLYSSAYLVDLAAQGAGFGVQWRNKRWVLWTLGMLLTVLFENYWIADEIYPFVS